MNLFYAFEIQFKIQDLSLYYSTAHLINWNCFLNIFFVYRDSEDLSDPDCTGYGGGPLVCARKDDSSR